MVLLDILASIDSGMRQTTDRTVSQRSMRSNRPSASVSHVRKLIVNPKM